MYKLVKQKQLLQLALITVVLPLGLGACQSKDTLPEKPPLSIGMIAFGDSGYHSNYLQKKQYMPPRTTQEAFVAVKRKKWSKEKRAADEFSAPPSFLVESVGSYVEASGLYPTAKAMTDYCKSVSCEFSVMLGDNIYPDGATLGVDGNNDADRFDLLFKQPFTPMGQDKPDYRIYTALGNHDWNTSRAGAMAQVSYMEQTKPFYMEGIFYRVKPPAAGGEIEIFVIDTEVLLASTTVYHDELNLDGSEVVTTKVDTPSAWTRPQNDAEKNMVQWLEDGLKNSSARWKLVVGHHPIWSTGGTKFTQARALRELILPTLCRYADVYFAGHEHSLELHDVSCNAVPGMANQAPLLEIISGAAAKQRAVNTAFKAYQQKTYPETQSLWEKGMTWGFSHIQIEGDKARVDMITTPNNGSGATVLEYSHHFDRRTAKATAP